MAAFANRRLCSHGALAATWLPVESPGRSSGEATARLEVFVLSHGKCGSRSGNGFGISRNPSTGMIDFTFLPIMMTYPSFRVFPSHTRVEGSSSFSNKCCTVSSSTCSGVSGRQPLLSRRECVVCRGSATMFPSASNALSTPRHVTPPSNSTCTSWHRQT
eukprot:105213-Rhodomonas_salina.1